MRTDGYLQSFSKTGHIGDAIRLLANNVWQPRIRYLLKRPVGRPPHGVRRYYASFTYPAQSPTTPRRGAPPGTQPDH